MAKYRDVATVQKWIKGNGGLGQSFDGSLASTLMWSIGASRNEAPTWWSARRDNWLVDFIKTPGNDILAGAQATMTSKIESTSWYVEGPKMLAEAYRDSLLNKSEFGAGWSVMVSKFVQSYFSRDGGGLLEHQRASIGDHTGPARAFSHLDESKCTYSGNPEWPVFYQDGERLRKIHRSQVSRITDMPSGVESDRGYGFCAVSRSIATALILMDIVRYKRERLSDLPPAGILFLSNLTSLQWEDIIKRYDTRQRNEGKLVWRDLMVVCGIDPAYPVTAEMLETSQLPEHYDEKVSTEIAVYTFSLAYRTDPREFWPVSSGPLGTATEAAIQHRKAKAKGEGVVFTIIERALNGPYALPATCNFRFDYRDDEDDKMAAEIAHQRLKNIRLMWESSPNRSMPEGDINEGIITTEQAQQLMLHWDLVPAYILGVPEEEVQAYDIRMQRQWGPQTRAYSDGSSRPVLAGLV
jgi:hypothetical protein